jgi:hypothetical protein
LLIFLTHHLPISVQLDEWGGFVRRAVCGTPTWLRRTAGIRLRMELLNLSVFRCISVSLFVKAVCSLLRLFEGVRSSIGLAPTGRSGILRGMSYPDSAQASSRVHFVVFPASIGS